jgi:hypothetical protein
VNQRIETPLETLPKASSDHDAVVIDICARGHAVFAAIAETLTMSPDDQASVLGELLDELDAERARIVSARDGAYRLAELESLIGSHPDDAEDRWNAANNGGMP